jgi:polar amino acid transport system substrate-binding protein
MACLVATAVLGSTAACTDASQQLSNSTSKPTSGAASFDPGAVAKDDALAALVPAGIKAKGTLTVGSDTSYAPAEFLGGADGQTPMGYDVDFAKAIAATLGLKVNYETAGFASILPALGPKYDLGISAFSINKTRLSAVNLVSYYKNGSIWAVQTGNPKGIRLDDLCGKTVAVQTGSVQETDVKERSAKCTGTGKPGIDIASLKNQTDVTTRLVAGGVDAMVSGGGTISYALSQTNGRLELLGDLYNPSLVGIAVAKDDVPLANLVSQVLNKLIADGTYGKILDGWGMKVLAIDKSVVNPEATK